LKNPQKQAKKQIDVAQMEKTDYKLTVKHLITID